MKNMVILQHDNAWPHTAHVTSKTVTKNSW